MQAQSPDKQSEASGDSFSHRQPGCAIHFPILLRRDTVDKLPKISPVEQLYRYMWRRKVRPAVTCWFRARLRTLGAEAMLCVSLLLGVCWSTAAV